MTRGWAGPEPSGPKMPVFARSGPCRDTFRAAWLTLALATHLVSINPPPFPLRPAFAALAAKTETAQVFMYTLSNTCS